MRSKIIIGSVLGFALIYSLVFGIAKPVTFAYGGETCVRQLTLFPTSMQQASDSGFQVTQSETIQVASKPIASLKTCFSALKPPSEGKTTVGVSPFGGLLARKNFTLTIPTAPVAKTGDFVGVPLATTRPLKISLSQPDDVFNYKLTVGEKTADCEHQSGKIACAVEPLELAQGQEYAISLARFFNEQQLDELGSGKVVTLQPLVLVGSSLTEGQTVYDKPTSYSYEYDAEVAVVEGELKVKNGETFEPVAAQFTTEGKKVMITPEAPLKRNSQFELTLKKVEATDGRALSAVQKTTFTMSGGPKVTSVSIGNVAAPIAGSVTITLDQEIANVDSIPKLVSVEGVAGSVTRSGNRLIVSYSAGKCVDFKIVIKKGLESKSGIAQEDDWSFNSRTSCYSLRTFGYSKNGRAINAYTFGSGGRTVLYTGSIHGNEHSSRLLMNAWINELEANVRNIPAGTQVVIVPSVNPDGVAANTRTNANNVDLNRNFDVSDWRSDVETVNGSPFPGGGGSAPGSEPETRALANLTRELRPALTMSYHSSASYAIANTCGNSPAQADTYARLTGYRNMTGASGAFSYQITGTYDDWICEKLGLPSVLIELATSTNAEFGRNKSALWAMLR